MSIKEFMKKHNISAISDDDFRNNLMADEDKSFFQNTKEKALSLASGAGVPTLEYLSSSAKAMGQVAKTLNAPKLEKYFNENKKGIDKDIDTLKLNAEKNPILSLAGEIVADPINLLPAGVITKGGKNLANTAKSITAGAGAGAITSYAKNYGNDNLSQEQKNTEALISSGIWGGLNGVFASKIISSAFSKLVGKGNQRLNESLKIMQEAPKEQSIKIVDDILTNPNAYGLSEPEAMSIKKSIDGDSFVMDNPALKKAKTIVNQNFNVEKWINDLNGVLSDEYKANLSFLARRHPEMFKSEADVFRAIKQIKDNPTHFFKNNNEKNALMAKVLKNGKLGELAINKKGGEIIHTTSINKEKRLKELHNRQNKILGNTELQGDNWSARLDRHSEASQTMATAKAGSVATNTNVTQKPLSLAERLEQIKENYDLESFLKDRENIGYKEARSENKLNTPRQIRQINNGQGYINEITPATFERNYAGDFSITKQDVKNIRDGKINDRILEKLDNDFGRIENDPQYAGAYARKNIADDFIENESHFFDENGNELLDDVALNNKGELIDSRGNVLFSNGNLGGAFAGGAESEYSKRDYNNDNIHDAKDNIYGAMVGLFGASVAKKLFPNAYKQSLNGIKLGANLTDNKKLYATHRASPEALKKMIKANSLPAPSYAIAKDTKTTDKFGDIAIIPKEKQINPKNKAYVYGGDVWTPRIKFNEN